MLVVPFLLGLGLGSEARALRSARDELREKGVALLVVVLPSAGRLLTPQVPAYFPDHVLAIGHKLNLQMLDATEPIRDALNRGEKPMQFDKRGTC